MLSGEISGDEQRSALSHADECPDCHARLSEYREFLQTASEAVSKLDDLRFEERIRRSDATRLTWRPSALWFRAAIGVAAAIFVTVAILYWQSETHIVSATELLDRAVLAQDRLSPKGHNVYVRSGSAACAAREARLVATAPVDSPACDKVANSLARAKWDQAHPLSARAFRNWRQSLNRKQDAVQSKAGTLTVTTTTSEGPVSEASLSLQETTLTAKAITLRFTGDLGVVVIAEEPESAPAMASAPRPASMPAERVTPSPSLGSSAPEVSPLDLAEVQAWIALHRAHADEGFEAVVIRTDASVEVQGVVNSEERRRELIAALASVPHLTVLLHTYADAQPDNYSLFPKRAPGGLSEPLAKDWLKQNFPGLASTTFKKATLDISKSIYGRAWILNQLDAAYRRLPPATASRLDPILMDQGVALKQDLLALAGRLEPLIGSIEVAETVSFERASVIDSAVTWLIYGSVPEAGSLEEQTARLRTALAK